MSSYNQQISTGNITKDILDTDLLEQYMDLLGDSGLTASMATFKELVPTYFDELIKSIEQHDERATRSQAHKIKGSCRSLGFARLGETMRFIEQDPWDWADLETKLSTWLTEFDSDYALAINWLKQQKSQS